MIFTNSEATYGLCFAEGDKDYNSFPLAEEYDGEPMDIYACQSQLRKKPAAPLQRAMVPMFMLFVLAT